MSANPNYDWSAWNELSIVEEHLKELCRFTGLVWTAAKDDEDLQTSISGLMTFTDMIRDRVTSIGEMIGPHAAKPSAPGPNAA